MTTEPSLSKEASPRKVCRNCGSSLALTRHHREDGITEYLCIVCHPKLHGANGNSFEKRMKRLEKRVKREIEVLERLHQYQRKGK